MLRLALAALLGAGLTAAAQEKKEKPKALPRIALNDPKAVAEDPDFAIQGEYEGELSTDGKPSKVGVQLVAQGDGKFLAKMYHGGLPGAGWNGEKPGTGSAARKEAAVVLMDEGEKGMTIGEVKDGVMTVKFGKESGTFRKVERKSPTLGAKPPAGAVVLFGKEGDEANWTGGKLVELSDGKFLNMGIKSKPAFGAFAAHLEFRLPWMPNSRGQQRGNSGFYLQDRYEVQVLDSFGLEGKNNECGGIYTLHAPSVNMCLPPMVWQTYDVEFTPAAFEGDKKVKNARATVRHNGVVVQDNVELTKETGGGQKEAATPGPIQFQNHGDPLVYRNVWVVEKQ